MRQAARPLTSLRRHGYQPHGAAMTPLEPGQRTDMDGNPIENADELPPRPFCGGSGAEQLFVQPGSARTTQTPPPYRVPQMRLQRSSDARYYIPARLYKTDVSPYNTTVWSSRLS